MRRPKPQYRSSVGVLHPQAHTQNVDTKEEVADGTAFTVVPFCLSRPVARETSFRDTGFPSASELVQRYNWGEVTKQ